VARSQYQYTPLVGPVWTAAVAASLAWLPAGCAQPARSLAPNRLGDVVEPFVEAVRVARDLQWRTESRQPQPVERRRYDWTVLAPFQPAVGYDPAGLQWSPVIAWPARSSGFSRTAISVLSPFPIVTVSFDPAQFPWTEARTPRAPIERRVLGDAVEPFTAALYRPDGLQWQPTEWSKPQRGLGRGVQVWSLLDPLPLAGPAFDPTQFPWTEARAPRAPIERRLLGDTVEPFVAALYRPDGLQWIPAGLARGLRGLAPNVPTWVILNPLPQPTQFDPALVPIIQTVRWQTLARVLRGDLVQPFTAALYRPERLEWIPSGRQPWRGLVPNRLGWIVGDPLPHPQFIIALPLQVEDRSAFRYGLWDQSGKRYLVTLQSGLLIALDEDSAEAQALLDQSRVKLDPEDTG
jgi:hypothetical protein